jgi:hypothetical protein
MMDDKMFNDLLDSVKEMNEIVQGKREPSRRFEFGPLDGKAIRE